MKLPFCSRLLVFHTELLKGGLPEHLIVASEQDVGSAASHVRGDGDRAKPARLGYDRSLALMLFRVEHLVPDATFDKLLRQPLGSLHRRRAHEHGLPLGVTALYLVGNGGELGIGSAENQVAFVFADHGLVRGNRDNGHVIDAAKLAVGGERRARHAGELLVQAEVVLKCDSCDGVRLGFNLNVFLRLDCLMETLGIAAALHDAARKAIDDLHFAPIDHVIMVELEEELRLERLTQSVRGSPRQIGVHFAAEHFLDFYKAVFGFVHRSALLVEDDVVLGIELSRDFGEGGADSRRRTGEP